MFIEKTYEFAGTSIVEGILTARFCNYNAAARAALLRRCGHEKPQFFQLPRPMVMKDAYAWLRAQGIDAVLPHGQRRGLNGRQANVELPVAEDQDAHVHAHAAWLAAEAERKAAFVARMAAARAAKRARQEG